MSFRGRQVPKVEELGRLFEERDYVAEPFILTSVYLALSMGKPLLVEGEPGCGKTELAKVLSEILSSQLIRLQCYEGLDASSTIYEWDYMRQLLKIRMEEERSSSSELEPEIFSERFLLKRPLLTAVTGQDATLPVLLIDEIDRADEEFEGFLLEFLGEFQVTIPEIGTFKAKRPPVVIITSNRTRELGDGLRRRCLYLYLTYPSMERELKIVKLKVPEINDSLTNQIVRMMKKLRSMDDIVKKPGVAETLDWASALLALDRGELDEDAMEQTLGCVVKNSDDLIRMRGHSEELLRG